ncbi:MAG: Ig-like domain-containing protein [Bacteroidaceae bacterium]|nr:Ig-like domain-containing protein [Bacteroidaceae bacterium]
MLYHTIKWTSSDPTRATVNQSGIVAVVDGAANGDFTITATTVNNKTATLNLKIVDEKIQIDTDQLTQAMAQ